jgi:long-chain fatty acid transport protein
VAVTTAGGTAVAAASGPTSASIDMPEQGYFSVSQRLGERFTLLADASVTRWGRIEELRAVNSSNGATRDLLSFGFTDTWRFALGGEYVLNERWTLRGGVARDESPVSTQARTVRLPDEDRRWVTVGAQWRLNENFTFDAGYAHIFVDDAAIASTRAQTGAPASFTSLVRGSYKSKVDILSVQVRYSLDAHL